MMTTKYLIFCAKSKLNIKSDYALAMHLQVTKKAIAQHQNKQATMSDNTCENLAEILECDVAILYAAMHAERAKNESARQVWLRIWRTLGGQELLDLLQKKYPLPRQVQLLDVPFQVTHEPPRLTFTA
ncbi:hypothetical protein [Chitinilyticum aquatile]|uniref:hypothetical protein n=1 Tax=Chitinilyticum aquatile TaxID=362520 RepID=UPI00049128E8|nr:hypothetical protein [Chitinilyticum aquatile]